MSTELIVQQSAGLPSVYDRIQDPLAFIEQMGKVFWSAKACGCQTESEGKLLALACLSERKNPFEINKTYHLMEGKLSMRSDAMLAHFRGVGGKFKWIKAGDGQSASIELTYDGNTITSTYTIDQAKQAGLVKDRGGWAKDPASMLQARAISRGIRMIAPEVIAGVYTPEEISGFTESDAAPTSASPAAKTTRKAATKETAKPADDEVIDAEVVSSTPAPATAQPSASATGSVAAAPAVTPAPATKAEEPPFEADKPKQEVAATSAVQATIPEARSEESPPIAKKPDPTALELEIAFAAKEAGYGATTEAAIAAIEAKLGKPLGEIPVEKQQIMLTNLRNAIAKAKAAAEPGK